MTTNQSPEEIRRDIERTRQELASDVDALHEKVSPSAIASRRMESARNAVGSAKEKVMGTASSVGDSAGSGLSSVGDSVSSVSSASSSAGGAASSATSTATRKTQGNPLAAGLIAFGAGWLVSSLLPASEKEQQAATAVKDTASEHSNTLVAPVKEAGQQMKESLAPAAQEAAESIRSTATEAAQNVKGEAQSAKDDVGGQARHAKDTVAGIAPGTGPTRRSSLDAPVGSNTGGPPPAV